MLKIAMGDFQPRAGAATKIAEAILSCSRIPPHRQSEKEVAGSPEAKARQPILNAKLNFLSFKIKFETTSVSLAVCPPSAF
jgi:hypothetical protein